MLVSIEYANAYAATRLGASEYWTYDAPKAAALATAERRLRATYTIPAETTDETYLAAICEEAFHLLRNPDLEQREALRAQGVTENKMDGETYSAAASVLSHAPVAVTLLKGCETVVADVTTAGIGAAYPTVIEERTPLDSPGSGDVWAIGRSSVRVS